MVEDQVHGLTTPFIGGYAIELDVVEDSVSVLPLFKEFAYGAGRKWGDHDRHRALLRTAAGCGGGAFVGLRGLHDQAKHSAQVQQKITCNTSFINVDSTGYIEQEVCIAMSGVPLPTLIYST
jgi:hypothetical protein